jgi:hypothetical protein
MKTNIHFLLYLSEFFWEWDMFQTKVAEKINTKFIIIIIIKESHAVYETMCKNIVQLGRPHMTIWHMLIACWIP